MRHIWIDEATEGMVNGKYRIETGSIQFEEDWPGFFLRGGDALYIASIITSLFVKAGSNIGKEEHIGLEVLKLYADQIFREVPFDQFVDEQGHSVIVPLEGEAVSVDRAGGVKRVDEDEEDEQDAE